jgi:hypothetical protein
MSCLLRLGSFLKKTASTLSKNEVGSLQIIVGLKTLCIFETLSLQMILAALGWGVFGLIQTWSRLYLNKRL